MRTAPCGVAGCSRVGQLRRGMCNVHYRQSRRSDPCSVGGCASLAWSRGLCNTHYSRWWKNGDPGPAERLQAPNGAGSINANGYRVVYVNGRLVGEHRVVMERMLGRPLLPGEEVHHKNGAKSDNTETNLELWSTSQPRGQRVVDKVEWAKEILAKYEPLIAAGVI